MFNCFVLLAPYVCFHIFSKVKVTDCPPIPLIGKDGDDVIDKITCELTGTESIKTQT